MKNFTLQLVLLAVIGLLVPASVLAQGVTTASFNGQVSDTNGEPLPGAYIEVKHIPTGTFYGNSTNEDGLFRVPYVKVGGPYSVEITFTGMESYKKDNIYLSLGQTYQINAVMGETAVVLSTVDIVANRNDVFDGNRDGQLTIIDSTTLQNVPTLTRSIQDFARFNPFANVNEDEDGFSVQFAGQNERYNSIYFDGVVNNDAFGLSGSGTNGGQTGVSPISIDAIEQFNVAVAPFDVRQSGFAGGAINAVTRSGTNNFEGSAYYFWRNEELAGKTPTDDPGAERTRLADFTARTFGARLGGPLVKNKLFFFVSGELQRDNTPQPFVVSEYNGEADAQQISDVTRYINSNYGYAIGPFDNNASFLNSEKFLAKLNWNLNPKTNVSLRHNYVKAANLEARSSDPFEIGFLNGSEIFRSVTNSTALEVNSLVNNNISNQFTMGLSIVRDDRDPFGPDFPSITLEDGLGEFTLGAERFSTANLLNQDVFTLNNNLTIYKGKHSILIGVNYEYFNAENLFIRENFGRYQWFNTDGGDTTGVERFLMGLPADRFSRSYSQVDNVTGDDTEAIATFSKSLIGFYVQDDFQASNNFKASLGIRLDVPIWHTDQPVNEDFNNNTIKSLEEAGYDLQGAQTGAFINTQILFSPRLGFNWDVSGNKQTQVRGGMGIFTSRVPLVWPGGAYNNYGLNIGGFASEDEAFEPDVNKQAPGDIDLNNITPGGQIDLFADDFKIPQVFKFNLAIDQKLPLGLIGTIEAIYTKNLNNVMYQNLNLAPSTRNLEGAGGDTRPLFEGANPAFGGDVIDDNYDYIMLASNTSKGHGYNVAIALSKPFNNGFTANVSYAYGDSYSLFDGSSSQNNSQWRGHYNPIGGRNAELEDIYRSSFAPGHRVFGQVSYNSTTGTGLSLNFNGQTGGYFSYVVDARNFRFVDDGGFDDNELIWIPGSIDEIPLVDLDYEGETYTASDQWELLDAFIEDDPHLSSLRGEYSERNGGTIPFEFTMDLRVTQDFKVDVGNGKTNSIQFSVDIFNFTNLLDKDWGRRRNAGSFGNYGLLVLDGMDGNVPSYQINTDLIDGDKPWEGDGNIDDLGFRSSRWQMQLGLRYTFN